MAAVITPHGQSGFQSCHRSRTESFDFFEILHSPEGSMPGTILHDRARLGRADAFQGLQFGARCPVEIQCIGRVEESRSPHHTPLPE